MRRTVFLLCLPVCSFALWFALNPGFVAEVKADDKKPSANEAAKPPVIDARELAEAKRALQGLSDSEYAAVCAAHYLVRPSIEESLFTGRVHYVCPLEPFEKPSSADLSTSEMLRLWALLDSGLPDSDALQQAIARLLRSSTRVSDDRLAAVGVHMLALKAALARLPEGKAESNLSKARSLLAAAERTELCSERSTWIDERGVRIEFYANQFWRAVINRCALDLGLKVNFRRWGTDLALLESLYVEGEGWTSRENKQPSPYESERENQDLHTNLLAMAALGLTTSATGTEFSREDSAAIELCAARAPRVLTSLIEQFEDLPFNGARLLLMLAGKFTPVGKDAIAWRAALLSAHCKESRLSGPTGSSSRLPNCLGLQRARGDESIEDIAEVALGLVGSNGGLLRPQAGPFANLTLGELGRLFWARTLEEASLAPEFASMSGHSVVKPEPITEFMEKGLLYLTGKQLDSGGWSGGGFNRKGQAVGEVADPASTAFVALALMRSGSTPLSGARKDNITRALEYMLKVVEDASEDGPKITSIENTQPQYKLGPLIDTSMAAQFLARAMVHLSGNASLYTRTEKALDKCLRKIEQSQDIDGTWNKNGGWAPVLQSAMMNQALELAELTGRKTGKQALEKSRGFYREDETATEVRGRGAGASPVSLYSGAAAQRIYSKDVREAQDGISVAVQMGKLSKGAKISEDTLVKAGFSRNQARAKVQSFEKYGELLKKLEDPQYLKGFGNNGGEEFISFMLCSESLVITGGEEWKDWNEQMHDTYKGIQNADGSWNGHHCITSPVVCTAATLLCLMADREVHVLIEPAPLLTRATAGKAEQPAQPSKGPVTGD
jgi:hypothetical protein